MKDEVQKILRIDIIIGIGITKIIIEITKIVIEIEKMTTKDQARVPEIITTEMVTDTVKNHTKKIRKDRNGNPKNQILPPVQMKKNINGNTNLKLKKSYQSLKLHLRSL